MKRAVLFVATAVVAMFGTATATENIDLRELGRTWCQENIPNDMKIEDVRVNTSVSFDSASFKIVCWFQPVQT